MYYFNGVFHFIADDKDIFTLTLSKLDTSMAEVINLRLRKIHMYVCTFTIKVVVQ